MLQAPSLPAPPIIMPLIPPVALAVALVMPLIVIPDAMDMDEALVVPVSMDMPLIMEAAVAICEDMDIPTDSADWARAALVGVESPHIMVTTLALVGAEGL